MLPPGPDVERQGLVGTPDVRSPTRGTAYIGRHHLLEEGLHPKVHAVQGHTMLDTRHDTAELDMAMMDSSE